MISRSEVCDPQGAMMNVTPQALVRMSGSAPGRCSLVGRARFIGKFRRNKRATTGASGEAACWPQRSGWSKTASAFWSARRSVGSRTVCQGANDMTPGAGALVGALLRVNAAGQPADDADAARALPRPIDVVLFSTTDGVVPDEGTIQVAKDIYRHPVSGRSSYAAYGCSSRAPGCSRRRCAHRRGRAPRRATRRSWIPSSARGRRASR
jgi:hypothetical protein